MLATSVFCGCDNSRNDLFKEYKGLGVNVARQPILAIDPAFEHEDSPACRFEFNCWDGIEVNNNFIGTIPSLKGYLIQQGQSVFFLPTLRTHIEPTQVLSFQWTPKQRKQICISYENKSFQRDVELVEHFVHGNDTVYKFKFYNVGQSSSEQVDLVCYISRRQGVLGMFLSHYNTLVRQDVVQSFIGELYDQQHLKFFKGNRQ
jgi:hypothetical protein